jgi:hypothetical protein
MANDLGSTLASLRASLDRAGGAVAASRPVSGIRRRPALSIAILVAAVAVVGGGTWLAVEGLPDWAPFSPKTFAEIARHARENPRDAGAQRDLGHAQWDAGRRARALASYGRALALDAGAADDRLVEHAVASFGRAEQEKAAALIGKYKLTAAARGLGPLTRSPRHAVRWGALRTLQKLGKDARSFYVNVYAADLTSSDCDVRRHAVERLGMLGDRSALAAIRKAKAEDEKTDGWFRGTCLGDREEKAEKAILARR